ncbi:MAG: glutamine--tRNA ligase/YqeY domain fusion protein [Deltaproteobacteria bacterium]|nr:glutamine--tRNA ligase/YqeY domain fusion protein [Deltaproteobacteria bacterium]
MSVTEKEAASKTETIGGESNDFVRAAVAEDVANGKNGGRVHTRFPPEPNGYLHMGHAKSICLNFGIARQFGGKCNLRFDDTNPAKEDVEYVNSIKEDARWLGADWEDREFYASDYFDRLYLFAEELIQKGLAYVDSLSAEEIRQYRGTLTEPGRNSPYRDRSVEENLDLFRRMKAGEFPDGTHVLRAKIDMASRNIILRDPTIYRIRAAHHHRTGDAWRIYPMYDFTHCLSDALEGITHSVCTLEFENNRPLYDWVLSNVSAPCHPRQIEFARLNLTYTVLSKRKLIRLVSENRVSGWDDPRMPTISGVRRRGIPPSAIRSFCEKIGVAKRDSTVDAALLDHCIREDLNPTAPRAMAVLRPIKVIIENYPDNSVEELDCLNHPENPEMGSRMVPFAREIFIEAEDFMEEPPKKYFRLSPGREVRLRYAYFITCTGVDKDPETGAITAIRATYDPATRGGDAPDGRKVKATLHWVAGPTAFSATVRLYDHLFTRPDPDGEEDFTACINPASLETLTDCRLEPSLKALGPGERVQFERLGYFFTDPVESRPGAPVFNRIVGLKDAWARIVKSGKTE